MFPPGPTSVGPCAAFVPLRPQRFLVLCIGADGSTQGHRERPQQRPVWAEERAEERLRAHLAPFHPVKVPAAVTFDTDIP